MRIMLFHAKNPANLAKLPSILEIEKNFSYVGSFESQQMLIDALENVFTTTQNLRSNWSKNGYRSTMVGDLMVIDYETTFVVDDIGFTEL